MATKTEVERKYEVPVEFVLPDLTGVAGVASVGDPVERGLDATYFDTAGLRLAANQVMLRRRTGGADDGWHVKRPTSGDDARAETQLPLEPDQDSPPREARDAVQDASGGEPLIAVARVRTRRLERPLRDGDGRVLALLADDMVSTNTSGADQTVVQRWRELEVELVDGSRGLLDAVEHALHMAGARPASSDSKLARALADRYPQPRVHNQPPAAGATGEVLERYARAQLDTIAACEPGVRRADPDAVHDVRVAVRRLRSTLRTFRPLLDRDRSEPVRDELHWLGGVLGGVRDGQVMSDRLARALAAEPTELVVGPVAARIRSHLAADTAEAHRRLNAALDSPRYAALLDALDRTVGDQLSQHHRLRVLRRLARKALRRADRRLRAATNADPSTRDPRLHDARKAYKRARYAVEALRPRAGKPARRLAKRLSTLQDVLGGYQDGVVTGHLLRDLGMRAHTRGDNAFTYGLLHARQYHAGEQQLHSLGEATRRAGRAKLRRWLDK